MMQRPEDPHYNRRLKGTRMQVVSHRIVMSILAASALFLTGLHFLPSSRAINKAFIEWGQQESQFVQQRRALLNTALNKSSEKIKKDKEEMEEKCI